jgi:shikimate dehydrogenase
MSSASKPRAIDGLTRVIAHVGWPTTSFMAPMIYNPWFEHAGIDAVVVPMGLKPEAGMAGLRVLLGLGNVIGALITMPYKVSVVGLLDRATTTVKVAGSCNAVRIAADGAIEGDMFDGEGFVRGVRAKGRDIVGRSALVVGSGGVGSAIAASLAKAGVARLALHDARPETADVLAGRLAAHYPGLALATGSNDPEGHDIVVNATPLGMAPEDPLPFDVARLTPGTFVGEVVMAREITPLLEAARGRGCAIQIGLDMLHEMIPAYLDFFDLPSTDAATLRRLSRVGWRSMSP